MKKLSRARVEGPLAPHAERFRSELARLGYRQGSAEHQVRTMAQVSRWLDRVGLDVSELGAAGVEQFLAARRAAGQRRGLTERTLRPLLGYLRNAGLVPDERPATATTPLDHLLADYHEYLVRDRALATRTCGRYEATARRFLGQRSSTIGGATGTDGLTAAEVAAFLLRECSRLGLGSARGRVAELRSLLRFLYLAGLTPTALAAAVPSVAGWHDARLVATLEASEVAAILEGTDRSTATGLRDFAVLTVLARLGLRAAELASLELADIDWRAGEIVVRGKGGRSDRLPLPVDVGEALVAYLRGCRPRAGCRALFVTRHAPWRRLHPNTVSRIVRVACRRAGLEPVGAHRLRHALASELLRRGSTLAEIGQVLRHRDLATTAIYAKVDRDALRRLAQPWPGSAR